MKLLFVREGKLPEEVDCESPAFLTAVNNQPFIALPWYDTPDVEPSAPPSLAATANAVGADVASRLEDLVKDSKANAADTVAGVVSAHFKNWRPS